MVMHSAWRPSRLHQAIEVAEVERGCWRPWGCFEVNMDGGNGRGRYRLGCARRDSSMPPPKWICCRPAWHRPRRGQHRARLHGERGSGVDEMPWRTKRPAHGAADAPCNERAFAHETNQDEDGREFWLIGGLHSSDGKNGLPRRSKPSLSNPLPRFRHVPRQHSLPARIPCRASIVDFIRSP